MRGNPDFFRLINILVNADLFNVLWSGPILEAKPFQKLLKAVLDKKRGLEFFVSNRVFRLIHRVNQEKLLTKFWCWNWLIKHDADVAQWQSN